MILNQTTRDFILAADAKVLATYSKETGVHCAPVSTIKIIDDVIVLVNYFMKTTPTNIQNNNNVALACWKNFEGFQIKGTVDYQTQGTLFEDIVTWAREAFPDRTVSGIFVLSPEYVFDISARTEKQTEDFYL